MAEMKKALEKYYKFVYRYSVDDSVQTDYDDLSIEVMVYRLTSDGADTPFHIVYMDLSLDALGYTKLFMLTDSQGSVLSAADLDQLYRRGEEDPVPTRFPAHDLTGLDRSGRYYARLREENEPIYFNQAMEQLVRAYGNGVKLSLSAEAQKEFSNEAMQQVAKWAFTGGEFFNRVR